MKAQTRLVLSDVHIPFQDDELIQVWLDMAKAMQPEGIDIIGDLIDCYTISRFDKNPRRKTDLQVEITGACALLRRIREACPDADIRYSEGNHENRLERMLWSTAKHLAPLHCLSIPKLMGLKELDIRYFDPKAPYKIGNLYYLHGDVGRKQNFSKSAGGRNADAIARAIGGSVICGHSHQMGYSAFRSWERNLEGYEVGCMCQFDLEYVIGVPPWQQGWAFVDFTSTGLYAVRFVRVIDVGKHRHILGTPNESGMKIIGPSKKHFILKGE